MELNREDMRFLTGVLIEHLVDLNADIEEKRTRLQEDPELFYYLIPVIERHENDAVKVEALWRRLIKE